MQKQEKPENCETKAADVLTNFIGAKFCCESTEYFGALAITMNS